jgi:hypothetical protein
MATLEEEYNQYRTQNTDQINQMYDAQRDAQLASLESAYNQSRSDAQAARDALPAQYQGRANDLAVQYERQRRNLNQQAAANGLNTGAGSQMQLALGGNYNRDYGNIRTAQQQAIDNADRGIRDLQTAYQSSVQQAVANNDYQRAQALLAEYKNEYQRQLQQAQTLASYGDFSAFANIPGYDQSQVDNMRSVWIASNPQLAYNTGAISAEDYHRMTGQWPAGYQAPAAGGGGSWRGDWAPQTEDEDETQPIETAGDALADAVARLQSAFKGNYNETTPVRNALQDALGRIGQAMQNKAANGTATYSGGNGTARDALQDATTRVKYAAAEQARNTMSENDYYNWLVKNGLATQAEVDAAKRGG